MRRREALVKAWPLIVTGDVCMHVCLQVFENKQGTGVCKPTILHLQIFAAQLGKEGGRLACIKLSLT